MGAGFSLLFPSLALLVVNRVPEERRGAAMGTFTAFFDLGVGIGSPLAGAAAALGGYEAAFVLAAGCALARRASRSRCARVAAASRRRSRRPRAASASRSGGGSMLADREPPHREREATSASTRSRSTASKPKAAPRTSSTSW